MLARFRRLRVVCGIAVALGAGIPVVHAQEAASQSQLTFQFNIPSKPLLAALVDFTDVTGVQLLYPSADELKVSSRALSGSYSPQDALRLMLQGTGITFRFTNQKTVTLEKQSERGARALGPVRVEGVDNDRLPGINGSRDVTATEGSGSYTSGALTIGSKMPQSIKDTPQSVSVITAQRLREQNINDFTQALAEAPGITLVQGTTSLENTFYSRGFEIRSIQIDGGAPLNTSFNFFPQIDMAQYDHVEVLRGAAGVFNGYGDPSGSVNLVRKKPLDHPQMLLDATAGSWNNYRVVLDATAPLALDDKLRGRAVVAWQDNEHFYDLANDSKSLLYGIIEIDLTPATLVSAGISHTRQDSRPWQGGLPRFQNGDDLDLSRSTCLCFTWNRWNFETTEVFAALEQKIGSDWSAKLNLTRNDQHSTKKVGVSDGPVNPLSGAGPTLLGFFNDYGSRQTSAEATVFGEFEVLGQRQEITIGANYVDTDGAGMVEYSSLILGTAAAPYQPYPGGPTYYSGSPNGARPPINVFAFEPNDPRYNEPLNPLARYKYAANGQVQSGAFLSARLTAFDRWHLTAGIRYSRYEWERAYDSLCTTIPTSGVPAANNCVGRRIGDAYARTAQDYSESDFTWPPSISLSYDATDDFVAYVGYTDGYVSQANFVDSALNPVDPITGANVEAGIKWQLDGGKLNLALAVYRIEQDGFAPEDQGSFARNPDGSIDSSYRVDNNGNRYLNGEVTPGVVCCYLTGRDVTKLSRGIDAELGGEILPGWQASASYTFNRNEYQGADAAAYKSTWRTGESFVTLQPEHLFKLWTSYRIPEGVRLRGLTFSTGVHGQSKAFRSGVACARLNPPNAQGASTCASGQTLSYSYSQPSYAVWSARIDYPLSEIWALALNVDNVTDTRYYKTMGSSASGNWYGEPRDVTFTLRGRF